MRVEENKYESLREGSHGIMGKYLQTELCTEIQ